jgi:hypothetical protein
MKSNTRTSRFRADTMFSLAVFCLLDAPHHLEGVS